MAQKRCIIVKKGAEIGLLSSELHTFLSVANDLYSHCEKNIQLISGLDCKWQHDASAGRAPTAG